MEVIEKETDLFIGYERVRQETVAICSYLQIEDYVVQPVEDVSPPKWHLGHTTWFFETFILKPYASNYREFNPEYHFVFNSYYETLGARIIRTDRGNLSRPTVKDIYRYRWHVDRAMKELLSGDEDVSDMQELVNLVILGMNHEQQHQELLYTDIKYILGHNPLLPAYDPDHPQAVVKSREEVFVVIPEGLYPIGFNGEGFSWDNEHPVHRVYLSPYSISRGLVTNREYLAFMADGGYRHFEHWHSDGWAWVKKQRAQHPLYWHEINGDWFHYTLRGLEPLDPDEPVNHVNYYEASAYASWRGLRLPTEFEWEVAAKEFSWGQRWEWTASAYQPYPGYRKAAGALGEYNGKFMVNQQVLRGASEVTPKNHSRRTYRNFFQPGLQWQYTGIRLAE